MLKISKTNFLKEQYFVKENKDFYMNILFLDMESSVLIQYLKDVLKLLLYYP
jgi:hypothetical protein